MLNPNLHWLKGIRPAKETENLLHIPTTVMREEKALCRAQLRTSNNDSDYITLDFSSGAGMSVVTNGENLSGTIDTTPAGKPKVTLLQTIDRLTHLAID